MKSLFAVLTMIVSMFYSYGDVGGVNVRVVSSGEGLYKYLDGYVYKGEDPDNYLMFNGELWRIMSISSDGMKIVKDESIGDMAFGGDDWSNSGLNSYLNSEYYYSLSDMNYIEEYDFKIDDISGEGEVWRGYVGLVSMSDYLISCGSDLLYDALNGRCESYIGSTWTLSADEEGVFYVGDVYFPDNGLGYEYSVKPVLYLEGVSLLGSGSRDDYFVIV